MTSKTRNESASETPIADALIPAHGLKPHGQVADTLRKLETDRAALIAALETMLVTVADRLACPTSAVALRKLAEACDSARATLAKVMS